MRIVLELDLLDDPPELEVDLTCGSVEDYERVKRLYPPTGDEILGGEREGSGHRYFYTTVWTSASNRVRLTAREPKALDYDGLGV